MLKNSWMILLTCLLGTVLVTTSCSTKSVTPTSPSPREPAPRAETGGETEGTRIDYVALQRHLGLERSNQELGFNEKAYDTCQVGYGYSSNKYCHRETFVVLHFQLVCRDSEGTVSEGVQTADMRALSDRTVRWNLKGISGEVQTDGEGYGQIHTVSPISQRGQRVKLAVGNDFLYMRANEITKVVTPKPWCNP